MRPRIEAIRALRMNYTWKGVYVWLRGRKRDGRHGWRLLWEDPEMVRYGQEAIAEGNFS